MVLALSKTKRTYYLVHIKWSNQERIRWFYNNLVFMCFLSPVATFLLYTSYKILFLWLYKHANTGYSISLDIINSNITIQYYDQMWSIDFLVSQIHRKQEVICNILFDCNLVVCSCESPLPYRVRFCLKRMNVE